MRTRNLLLLALVLVVLLGATETSFAQCAMCKAVLQGSAEGRQLSKSLDTAILVMLVAPYTVIGTFLTLAFRRRWQPAVGRALRRVLFLS